MKKRTIANTSTTRRYGHSAARCPSVGAIASSIARLMTIGIASERPVITHAHRRPTVLSRHCSRRGPKEPFTVGQRLRSGGSTERKRLVAMARYQGRRRQPLTRLSWLRQPAHPAAGGGPAQSLHRPTAEREHEQAGDEQQEEESLLHGREATDVGAAAHRRTGRSALLLTDEVSARGALRRRPLSDACARRCGPRLLAPSSSMSMRRPRRRPAPPPALERDRSLARACRLPSAGAGRYGHARGLTPGMAVRATAEHGPAAVAALANRCLTPEGACSGDRPPPIRR